MTTRLAHGDAWVPWFKYTILPTHDGVGVSELKSSAQLGTIMNVFDPTGKKSGMLATMRPPRDV